MALAERMLNARFRRRRWSITAPMCIASDGDLMEGISHEACSLAGHLKLNRLIVLFDDNGISIDGPTALAESTDVLKRFEAYGWAVSARRRPRRRTPSPTRCRRHKRATSRC